MTTSFACADLGKDCPAVFTLETEEEVLEHVALHVQRMHPDVELNDETVAAAKSVMKSA